MIGKSGERGSGISVLTARHDDDDDLSITLYTYKSYSIWPDLSKEECSFSYLFCMHINTSLSHSLSPSLTHTHTHTLTSTLYKYCPVTRCCRIYRLHLSRWIRPFYACPDYDIKQSEHWRLGECERLLYRHCSQVLSELGRWHLIGYYLWIK